MLAEQDDVPKLMSVMNASEEILPCARICAKTQIRFEIKSLFSLGGRSRESFSCASIESQTVKISEEIYSFHSLNEYTAANLTVEEYYREMAGNLFLKEFASFDFFLF